MTGVKGPTLRLLLPICAISSSESLLQEFLMYFASNVVKEAFSCLSAIYVICVLNPEQHRPTVKQSKVCLVVTVLAYGNLIEENEEHVDWIVKDELDLSDVQFIVKKTLETTFICQFIHWMKLLRLPWKDFE